MQNKERKPSETGLYSTLLCVFPSSAFDFSAPHLNKKKSACRKQKQKTQKKVKMYMIQKIKHHKNEKGLVKHTQ